MYKKITHHIVEEHFDHPIAAELKNKVDKTVTPTVVKPKPKLSGTNCTPAPKGYEIYSYYFPPLNQVEKDSLTYWGQLSSRIRSLVISITSSDEDIDLLKTKMADDISKISKIVKDAYGDDASTTFNKLLSDVTLSLVDVLMLVKKDEDTTKAMTVLADANKALGDFLESASKSWPSKAVVDIFTQVENLYIMQAISRIKKEWAAEVASADNAYHIMVVKQDNNTPSFADIFSNGIIEHIEQNLDTEMSKDLTDYMET